MFCRGSGVVESAGGLDHAGKISFRRGMIESRSRTFDRLGAAV
jgi:hypothetical protein